MTRRWSVVRRPIVRRGRRGFTLMEMGVSLAVMAIAALLVAPAFSRLGEGKPETGADKMVKLLKQARNYAIEKNLTVTLRVDPVSGDFRVDTVGAQGMGILADTTLDLGASESFETPLDRLQFTFRPTGSVFGDSVLIRGVGTSTLLTIDTWTGEARLVVR